MTMKKQIFIAILVFFCYEDVIGNCILSMKRDISSQNQPLILSSVNGNNFYSLDNSQIGSLQLMRDEFIKLACPSSNANAFTNFPSSNTISAKCKNGVTFEVDGKSYTFDQFQCTKSVSTSVQATGVKCSTSNSELLKIGFQYENNFVPVYQICFDKSDRGAVYSEIEITPNIFKNDGPRQETAFKSDPLFEGANLDEDFACENQAETFERIGKKLIKKNDRCCFAKGQLVNPADVEYGTQQLATYHYLNVVPQWSTCNRANWIEVENRVRALIKTLNRPLKVWTGTFKTLDYAKWLILKNPLYLHYSSKKTLPVMRYIWKVVYDPLTHTSLAIISINKPDLVISDLESNILCKDICHNVNWMNFLERQNLNRGYIFCCDLNDFEFAFQIRTSPFPRNSGKILRQ